MATRAPVKRDWEAIIAAKLGRPVSTAQSLERDLQEIWDEYDQLRNWDVAEADDTPRVQALAAQFRLNLVNYQDAFRAEVLGAESRQGVLL